MATKKKAPAKKKTPAASKPAPKKKAAAAKAAPAQKKTSPAAKKPAADPKADKSSKSTSAAKPPAAPSTPSMSKSTSNSQPTPASAPEPTAKTKAAPTKASASRDKLRSRILGRAKNAKPISFSLDEVKEIAKRSTTEATKNGADKPTKSAATKAAELEMVKPAKPNHVQAASLADILGFTPGGSAGPADESASVPEKFKRYYKLLIELRNHVTGQLDLHSEDTLKRSSKDDAGDLSSYGQHMADAGTDTFDRDFALSLVSSEQEALSEIEAAIRRIKTGTYGVCEINGTPINKDRLLAVPFTRYSAEAQKEIERNRHRVRTQAGLFGEMGEDAPKISENSDDD